MIIVLHIHFLIICMLLLNYASQAHRFSKKNGTLGVPYSTLQSFFRNGHWDLLCKQQAQTTNLWQCWAETLALHIATEKCFQLLVSICNNATSLETDHRVLPFILIWTSTRFFMEENDSKMWWLVIDWQPVSLLNQKMELWLSPLVRVRREVECTCLPHAGFVHRAQSLCKYYFQIALAYPLSRGIIALHSYL